MQPVHSIIEIKCSLLAAAHLEQIDSLSAMRTGKTAHVLDNAQGLEFKNPCRS